MSKAIARENRWAKWLLQRPLFRRYLTLVQEDLTAVYARDLRKWLIIAPVIGLTTGLVITGIVVIILGKLWPAVLSYYLRHHWAIVPGLVLGFLVTGLIMQFLTSDPNEHSTEEIIRSYHEHEGKIDTRFFVPKMVAAITTVGFGGSAALEGPSIYGGGAIGSWLWTKLRRLHLDDRDRRIMLICGAAAGMSAVFRAPLTGIVFALEMPYRDDLAHEALVPSLIASVVSFVTLSSFLGAAPLFDFVGSTGFARSDLYWSALLGLIVGLIAMTFVITFRRARSFFVTWSFPHWLKLAIGGLLTGLCGLLFLHIYPGNLVPIGPNYEAVGDILSNHHSTSQLLIFSALKLGGDPLYPCRGRRQRHVCSAVSYRREHRNSLRSIRCPQLNPRPLCRGWNGLVHLRGLQDAAGCRGVCCRSDGGPRLYRSCSHWSSSGLCGLGRRLGLRRPAPARGCEGCKVMVSAPRFRAAI